MTAAVPDAPACPRAWLVGEDNPHSDDARHALYPLPEGCAGWRLCHKVMGLGPEAYLRDYRRSNLCEGRWDAAEARENATSVLLLAGNSTPVVMLGAKVARAFGAEYVPFRVFVVEGPVIMFGGAPVLVHLVCLPHPSGRCRTWNAPVAYDHARRALRSVGAIS